MKRPSPHFWPRGLAPLLFVLGLGAAACSEEGSESSERPLSDAGPAADAAGPGLSVTPQAPVLTPCPSGWEERFDEDLDFSVCEPWPDSSPVEWVCPEGWRGVVEDDVQTCEPSEASPVEWVCPEGWREVVEDDVQTCDPFPEGGAARCEGGEAHLPGEPGCTRIGTACPPTGDFPEGLPADAPIVYVRAGARQGVGTFEAPYGALSDIDFSTLPAGTVVALAGGTYAGAIEASGTLTLWGACPEETVLTASDDVLRQGVLQLSTPGADVTARNLTIRGETRMGALVDSASTLRLQSVIVDRCRRTAIIAEGGGQLEIERSAIRDTQSELDGLLGTGLAVQGGASARVRSVVFERNRTVGVFVRDAEAALVMEDSVVRDTQSQASDGAFGHGLIVQSGARADVRRSLLAGNRELGVFVAIEAALLMENSVVRDTKSRASDRAFGRGLTVQQGARAEVRRSVLAGNRELGVFVATEAALVMEDSVVRDTQSRLLDGAFGVGLGVRRGAQAEVRRSVFELNRSFGVDVEGARTQLVIEDSVVRNTQSQASDGTFGSGLQVQSGARAEVRRSLFLSNRTVGLVVASDAELIMADTVVRDTQSRASDGAFGRGLQVENGARAEVRRSVFARNREFGVVVTRPDAALVLEDAVVRETRSGELDDAVGGGLFVSFGARAEVQRSVFSRNRHAGVLVSDDAELMMADAVVRDTQSRASDGEFGRGLDLQLGARAEVRRSLFLRNRAGGVLVAQPRTELMMEDAVVRDTQSRASDGASGRGLTVQQGARAEVRRSIFDRNRQSGVLVSDAETQLAIEDAVVRDTQSQESDGRHGVGLAVQGGARAEVGRSVFARNQEFGVLAVEATATLTDVSVDTVRLPSCFDAIATCLGAASGVVGSGETATVTLRRVQVSGAAQCGIYVDVGAALDGMEVVLADNGVGACFFDPLYDQGRLEATFVDNAERVAFDSLPPPPEPIDD